MRKDFNILNYFNMRSLFLGIGISKILIQANEYFYISIILGTILGTIILYLMRHFSLKKNILNVVIAAFFIIIGLNNLINMISTMYLTEMPKIMVGIPLILLLIYILSKRDVVIFRVGNILLVLNLILYILSNLALIPLVSLDNFSYTNTPLSNILISAVEYALYSAVPVLLSKHEEYKNISVIKTYLISSLTLGLLFFLTFGILGPSLVRVYRYPEYVILKKISILHFLENIENIICFMWIFDVFMFLLSSGLCIKRMTNKLTVAILLPILLIITAMLNSFYEIVVGIYKYIDLGIIIALILLLAVNWHKMPNDKKLDQT